LLTDPGRTVQRCGGCQPETSRDADVHAQRARIVRCSHTRRKDARRTSSHGDEHEPERRLASRAEGVQSASVRIRVAAVDDAPAMGRVMVESWLSAHRGQVPEAAWQKRVAEWTPEVSARGWARTLSDEAGRDLATAVYLVAEDDAGDLIGLVSGAPAEDGPRGSIAEVGALYVLPDRRGQGVGGSLLTAVARAMVERGVSALHVGVLASNLPARSFYEAKGARAIGERTFDEHGYLLPLTIYAWTDISVLAGGS
jgi:GNAT superfamily N-acetyltransferase